MRKILFLVTSIFVASFVFAKSPEKVNACSPSGDPWFNTSLNFNKSNLPTGVIIKERTIPHNNSVSYRISNSSSEALYLFDGEFNDDYYGWKDFSEDELPVEYQTKRGRNKLVGNKAYYWGRLNVYDSKDKREGWVLGGGGYNNESEISTSAERLAVLVSGESFFNIKIGDNRPLIVDIPKEEEFFITGYYNGHEIEISGTRTYTLNKEYDPLSFSKSAAGCDNLMGSTQSISYIFYVVVALVSIGIIAFIYAVFKKIKQ